MDADWEFEVGGGAPVIDARWPGFVDLHLYPERVREIMEAAAFPPLAALLLALNGPKSPFWTSKCDFWQSHALTDPTPGAVSFACYVDLLPVVGEVFQQPKEAESFCRALVARLEPHSVADCAVELVIRSAVAGAIEGFGVTAYMSAEAGGPQAAAQALTAALDFFGEVIATLPSPERAPSKIQ